MEKVVMRALANAIPVPGAKPSFAFRVDDEINLPLDHAKTLFDAGAAIPVNAEDVDKLKAKPAQRSA